MMSMIEKVARDIAKSCCPWVEPERIAKYVDDSWRCYELNAIAAIKAMREPSEAMIEVACGSRGKGVELYTAMINAALGEHA